MYGNYHPVSLTSVCSKVMESIVYDSMISFLRSNNLISKDQFGFLARRSTCTQLLATLHEWTLFVDTGSKIDSVCVDFAKAFDSISRQKLLFKVECYGFSPSLARWLFSFLTARFQQVYIGQYYLHHYLLLVVFHKVPCLVLVCSLYISMTFLIFWYHQFKVKYLQMILNSMLLTLLIQFHLCPYHCQIFVNGLKDGSLILVIRNVV